MNRQAVAIIALLVTLGGLSYVDGQTPPKNGATSPPAIPEGALHFPPTTESDRRAIPWEQRAAMSLHLKQPAEQGSDLPEEAQRLLDLRAKHRNADILVCDTTAPDSAARYAEKVAAIDDATWLETGEFELAGRKYGFAVYERPVLNRVPKQLSEPSPEAVARFESHLNMWRLEDIALGRNNEERAREAELKSASRALRKGLTLEELAKAVGEPDEVKVMEQVGDRTYRTKRVSYEKASQYSGEKMAFYLPGPGYTIGFAGALKKPGPYRTLTVWLDASGHVDSWDWLW